MDPLIIPREDQPLLDDKNKNLLDYNTWYRFFRNLNGYVSTAGGIIQFGKNAQRLALSTQGLTDGTLWSESDTGLVYQWRVTSTSVGWVCVLGTQQLQMTLTTALTNIDAPTTGALMLVYFIDQDGTGGRAIHWNNGFGYASDSLGNALANTRSVFHFTLINGLYVMSGHPPVDLAQ
jgi:hypothetical protein